MTKGENPGIRAILRRQGASLVTQPRRIHPQCRKRRFNIWVEKILWRRKRQPTVVFLPGEIPWREEPGGRQPTGSQKSRTWRSDYKQQADVEPKPKLGGPSSCSNTGHLRGVKGGTGRNALGNTGAPPHDQSPSPQARPAAHALHTARRQGPGCPTVRRVWVSLGVTLPFQGLEASAWAQLWGETTLTLLLSSFSLCMSVSLSVA